MIRRFALVLVIAVTGCASGQDPGITPTSDGGPITTSRALVRCPVGGPDATTDPAGCLDADGRVLRP